MNLVSEGQPRIAGVGTVEVGDHKVDELYAEVVWRSKLDGQGYLPEGY